MERIPNELWDSIVSFVPKNDLYNCRLVCKSWADFAEHLVFHTFHFAVFSNYLERLYKISSHPRLRTFVRRLIVDGSVLDESYLKYDVWHSRVDLKAEQAAKEQFCMEQGLSEAKTAFLSELQSLRKHRYGYYHRTVKMIMMQQDQLEEGLAIKRLRDTLRQLPRLDEVVYVSCTEEGDAGPYYTCNTDRLGIDLPSSIQTVSNKYVKGARHEDLVIAKRTLEKTLVSIRRIHGRHVNPLSHVQPLTLLLSALDYPGSSGLQQL